MSKFMQFFYGNTVFYHQNDCFLILVQRNIAVVTEGKKDKSWWLILAYFKRFKFKKRWRNEYKGVPYIVFYHSTGDKGENGKSVMLHFSSARKANPSCFCEETISFSLNLGKKLSKAETKYFNSGFIVKSKVLIILFSIFCNVDVKALLTVNITASRFLFFFLISFIAQAGVCARFVEMLLVRTHRQLFHKRCSFISVTAGSHGPKNSVPQRGPIIKPLPRLSHSGRVS